MVRIMVYNGAELVLQQSLKELEKRHINNSNQIKPVLSQIVNT